MRFSTTGIFIAKTTYVEVAETYTHLYLTNITYLYMLLNVYIQKLRP